MKQVIKVKVLTGGCEPTFNASGDWFDLRAAEDVEIPAPYALALHKSSSERFRNVVAQKHLIPLGVAMQLPEGMEAIVAPRSSAYNKFNIIEANSIGIIDNSYNGPNDQWYLPVLSIGPVSIEKGTRICQFRIQPSQRATFMQKLKWLLSSGVEFEFVEDLDNPNRSGFGSTGIK